MPSRVELTDYLRSFPLGQFAKDVKRGKGGRGIFLDPWWLFGPGHEVTANKRLWDLGAELVDNIPHSLEVSYYLWFMHVLFGVKYSG